MRRKLAYASLVLLVLVLLVEISLQVFVPLSALVDPSTFLKVWFLENVHKLRDPGWRSIHESDPVLGWRLKPNLRTENEATNSRGVRGTKELEYERTPGLRRGVCIGDSFTYGWAVKADEAYPAQMEGLLTATEMINLGVDGYGSDQAYLRWSTEGKKYHPDFVVLGYYIDDFHRNSDAWRFDAPKPRFEIANGRLELSSDALPRMEDIDGNEKRILAELAPLLRTPRVWTALEFALARVASVRRGHHEPAESFENKATLTTALIAETQRSCREVGARLAVVFFCPDRDDSDEARIRAVLESACQGCGVPFSSLPRHLGAKPDGAPSAAVFSKLNGHWTAHGHRLAAAEIVAFLRAQGFAN